MKPLFLDNPPRYTRTRRDTISDVDYACSVEINSTSYSPLWWKCVTIVVTIALVVIWVTR